MPKAMTALEGIFTRPRCSCFFVFFYCRSVVHAVIAMSCVVNRLIVRMSVGLERLPCDLFEWDGMMVGGGVLNVNTLTWTHKTEAPHYSSVSVDVLV